ncbi:MAG TPA: PrsW family intramembrane metalloprotease [Pseudonocardiaceae bacterium]
MLLPVVGAVAMGICGLLVLGLVGSRIGLFAVLVGAVGALLPVAIVVGAFLWVDRWEPEPPGLLLAAFGWGACVATLSALIINSTAKVAADTILGQGSGDLVSAVVSAPLVEEGMKVAFLFGLMWARRLEFDGVVDGIVYAGLVAAGFAFTENILYFGRAFAQDGLVAPGGGVIAVFVLRGLLSPFAHPVFTAMTGIGIGIAVNSRLRAVRVFAPILGYLGSVTLHALWNGSATIAGGMGFVLVYVVIMVPLFIGMVILVVWQRRREQRVLATELPGLAAAGLIAPSEVGLLASLSGRRGWRAAVRRQAGSAAAKAVAAYQSAVTELAFLRARMARGTAGPAAQQRHDELVDALLAARVQAVARPDALRAAWPQHPPGWQPPPTGPPPAWRPPPGGGPYQPGPPYRPGPRYQPGPPYRPGAPPPPTGPQYRR